MESVVCFMIAERTASTGRIQCMPDPGSPVDIHRCVHCLEEFLELYVPSRKLTRDSNFNVKMGVHFTSCFRNNKSLLIRMDMSERSCSRCQIVKIERRERTYSSFQKAPEVCTLVRPLWWSLAPERFIFSPMHPKQSLKPEPVMKKLVKSVDDHIFPVYFCSDLSKNGVARNQDFPHALQIGFESDGVFKHIAFLLMGSSF